MPVKQARSETRGRPPVGVVEESAERFHQSPQRLWKQCGGHPCSRYLAADGAQGREVLLHARRDFRGISFESQRPVTVR